QALARVGLGVGEPVGVEQDPRELEVWLREAGLDLEDGADLVLGSVEIAPVLALERGDEAGSELLELVVLLLERVGHPDPQGRSSKGLANGCSGRRSATRCRRGGGSWAAPKPPWGPGSCPAPGPTAWRCTREASATARRGATARRTGPIRSSSPAASERIPGVSSSRPPTSTSRPSTRRSAGGSPRARSPWSCCRTPRPSRRASDAPKAPVSRI